MKSFKILGFIACLMFCFLRANAEECLIDGLYYTLNTTEGTAQLHQHWIVNSQGWNVVKYYEGNIVIPEQITFKGKTYKVTEIFQAFQNCPTLVSVTVPSSVKKIHSYSFYKLPALKWVRFESGSEVITVEYNNFGSSNSPDSFTSLECVELGRPIESSNSPFSGLPSLKQMKILNGCPSLKVSDIYYSNIESLTIEDDANPLKLTNVGGGPSKTLRKIYLGRNISTKIFNSCNSLESVEIGNMVTELTDGCFSSCNSLTDVKIGSGLKKYGDSCFHYCTNLENVQSESNPETIGKNAFGNCSKLKAFDFGKNLITIGDGAFYKCSALASVDFGNTLVNLGATAFSGCNLLNEIVIPASTEAIGYQAFDGTNLTTLTIEDGQNPIIIDSYYNIPRSTLKHLYAGRIIKKNDGALFDFNQYGKLEDVVFGQNVTELCSSMFKSLESLLKIEIRGAVSAIPDYFCWGCVNLEEVSITSDIKTIGIGAFLNCKKLKSPYIGNQLEFIGRVAFADCYNWGDLTLPASVVQIEDGAFRNAIFSKLSIMHSDTPLAYGDYPIRSAIIDSLYIDRFFLSTENLNFNENNATVSVKFGNNISKIQESLFRGAKVKDVIIGSNIDTIESHAFDGSSGLKEIDIPSSVSTIGYESFNNCRDLEKVTLHDGLKKIESSAFWNCHNIKEITIPSTVEQVSDQGFACGSLDSITIADSQLPLKVIKGLHGGAFDNDAIRYIYVGRDLDSFDTPFASYSYKLNEVEFGPYVTRIADGAFRSGDLSKISSAAIVPPNAADGTFPQSAYKNATLYIPKSAAAAYETAPMWKNFVNRVYVSKKFVASINVIGCGKVLLNGSDAIIDIEEGEPLAIEIFPEPKYKLKSLTINGNDLTMNVTEGKYTIPSVTGDIAISAEFEKLESYSINLKYDASQGSVLLNQKNVSNLQILEGDPVTIEINPFEWFRLKSVLINDRTYDIPDNGNKFTIEAVTSNINIVIEFSPIPVFDITADCDPEKGSLTLNGGKQSSLKLHEGESLEIKIIPAKGYELIAVTINDKDMPADPNGSTFSISSIREDVSICALFAERILSIKISDSEKGCFVQKIKFGQAFTIEIQPAESWKINTVCVNGIDQTSTLEENWLTIQTIVTDTEISVVYVNDYSTGAPDNAVIRNVKVYTRPGKIEIVDNDIDEAVMVFDTQGHLIHNSPATEISVDSGVYLVKIGDSTFKILVK